MKSFRELKVWQKAHELVLDIYKRTADFPKDEFFSVASEARRDAVEVAARIVRGWAQRRNGDFPRYLFMAIGSATQLEYHLLLAKDLGLLAEPVQSELQKRIEELNAMLESLILRVKARK
jgi:four helix bundle protein